MIEIAMLADSSQAISTALWIAIGVGGLLVLSMAILLFQVMGLWIQGTFASANITLGELIGQHFRKVDSRAIVIAKIKLVQAGIEDVSTSDLERHYLAGGRVQNVVTALIAADRAKIPLTWKTAADIDLTGQDILETVQASIDSAPEV